MTQRVQMALLVCVASGGFVYLLYPRLVISSTDSGHWVMVLFQGLLQIFFMLIYKKGLDYFPDKDLIDIFRQMGKWVAFIILVPYAFILTSMVGFGLRAHSEEIIAILRMSRTPYWAVLAFLVFISAFAAIKGLGTMLRASVIVFIITNLFIVFNTLTVTANFDFYNAFPVWPSSLQFLWDSNFNFLTGFSPLLFLGFVPSENNMKYSHLFWVWTYVTFIILLSVYIPLFIFGQETVVKLHYLVEEAVDTVDMRWFIFSRQTIFFGMSLIAFTIFLNALLLWKAGQLMQKTFNWKKNKRSYWIIAFSSLAFLMGFYVPNQYLIEKSVELSTGIHALLIVIIPLIIFIYGVINRRRMAVYEKK